ncbi:nuclear transport factor 2 family protein [Streptomyces sp. NPDC056470]|uniref:nuclear transport factor 2 family protein n=1 Tax=Streptomyces sp. NPDC056470 TaxID=3345831 RepID=UPI0036AD6366
MHKNFTYAIAATVLAGSGLTAVGTAVADDNTTSIRHAESSVSTTAQAGSTAAGQAAVDRTSQDNAKLLRDFYSAFTRGDVEAAKKFVTADFLMHVPGKGTNAGEYWGPDGLAAFMKNIQAWNGGAFAMQVPHVAVSGEHGFTREVVDINRKHDPDRMWQLRFTMNYTFKAGKVSEAWTMPEDQRLYDAYWTAPQDAAAAKPAAVKGSPAASPEPAPSHPFDVRKATNAKNLAFGREFYKKFWEGDLEGIRAFIDKDIVITIPGRSDISGTFKGFDGFLEFRDKVMATVGDRYKLDVAAMAADDKGVFAKEFIRMNHPWNDQVRPVTVSLYYTVQDGKIVKMEDFPGDTYAWEAFFTKPRA